MTFKRCYLDPSEKTKRGVLEIMRLYLEKFNEQVISQIDNG